MHVTLKYLYITLFCISAIGRLSAQQVDSSTYSHRSVRSAGIAFPGLNYPLLSPLNHTGYAIGFHSTRFRERPKSLTQFQLHSEFGLLYNNVNDSYITSLSFRGNLSRHWNITDKTRPLRLLFGAAVDGGIDIYLKEDNTNNPMAYFFNLSLSPTALVKYRFRAGKTTLELGQQIDLPVGSLISTSDYSVSMPYALTEKEADFFDAMRLVSLNDLVKCKTISTLDIIPSAEKRRKLPVLRITYIFSGMKYTSNDVSIKSVDHIFLFGAIFNLFR